MAQLEHRNIDVQHCQVFSTSRGQAARASSMTCKPDLSAHGVKQVMKIKGDTILFTWDTYLWHLEFERKNTDGIQTFAKKGLKPLQKQRTEVR